MFLKEAKHLAFLSQFFGRKCFWTLRIENVFPLANTIEIEYTLRIAEIVFSVHQDYEMPVQKNSKS